MIFSKKSGKFAGIKFAQTFEKNNLLEVHCTHSLGDEISAYTNTTNSLGTVLFKANSVEEMVEITSNLEKYMEVIAE